MTQNKNIGILLSGCGVYDGAEIQESIFAMLAIEEIGANVTAIGIDEDQHHVINHLTGEVQNEKRNMLTEAARIARGNITSIAELDTSSIDALVIPGGFGSAKNLTSWAFEGSNSIIHPEVKQLILKLHEESKPIVALCVSPVVIAKAFEDTSTHPTVTIGSTSEKSPYSIIEFQNGIEATNAQIEQAQIGEVVVDQTNKIITAPCYMMDASLLEVKNNISNAINVLKTFLV